jgi:hypothetical protein
MVNSTFSGGSNGFFSEGLIAFFDISLIPLMIGIYSPESSGPRYDQPACQLKCLKHGKSKTEPPKTLFLKTLLQNKKLAELSRKFLFRVKNYKFRFRPISAQEHMFIGHRGNGSRPRVQEGTVSEGKPKSNCMCLF